MLLKLLRRAINLILETCFRSDKNNSSELVFLNCLVKSEVRKKRIEIRPGPFFLSTKWTLFVDFDGRVTFYCALKIVVLLTIFLGFDQFDGSE